MLIPVIVCPTFYRDKTDLLKGKLKGCNIFIGDDFSPRIGKIRRELSPHLKKAKSEGKRATMLFDHLLIDGR